MVAERIVVAGPSGTGKTTFVEDLRRPGDVVWDLDKMAEIMLLLPIYPRPKEATDLLDALRNTVVEWLRLNEQVRAYLIVADEHVAESIAARVQGVVYLCHRGQVINPEGGPSGGQQQ